MRSRTGRHHTSSAHSAHVAVGFGEERSGGPACRPNESGAGVSDARPVPLLGRRDFRAGGHAKGVKQGDETPARGGTADRRLSQSYNRPVSQPGLHAARMGRRRMGTTAKGPSRVRKAGCRSARHKPRGTERGSPDRARASSIPSSRSRRGSETRRGITGSPRVAGRALHANPAEQHASDNAGSRDAGSAYWTASRPALELFACWPCRSAYREPGMSEAAGVRSRNHTVLASTLPLSILTAPSAISTQMAVWGVEARLTSHVPPG